MEERVLMFDLKRERERKRAFNGNYLVALELVEAVEEARLLESVSDDF